MQIDLSKYEVWFVTGSQHLYGPKMLEQVAEHSQEIARALVGGHAGQRGLQAGAHRRPTRSTTCAWRPTTPRTASA